MQRGSTTGILFDEKLAWSTSIPVLRKSLYFAAADKLYETDISQRARLVEQVNAHTGSVPLLRPTPVDDNVGNAEIVPVEGLNELFFDIGFASEPIQCTPSVCKELKEKYDFKSRQTFDVAYK